jgi:hypothetical protein
VKKLLLTGAAGLAVLAAPLAASAHPYGGYDHGNAGAAVAAGLFGMFLGAAIASSGPHYAPQSYGYDEPYAYGQPYGYGDYQRCWWQTQPYRDYWGRIEYRQVQVCR